MRSAMSMYFTDNNASGVMEFGTPKPKPLATETVVSTMTISCVVATRHAMLLRNFVTCSHFTLPVFLSRARSPLSCRPGTMTVSS